MSGAGRDGSRRDDSGDKRRERQAVALRENLKRRKVQLRARSERDSEVMQPVDATVVPTARDVDSVVTDATCVTPGVPQA